MKISFSTGSLFGLPLKTVFRLAADAGFEGVEVLVAPEVLARGAAGVLGLARKFGLSVNAVHRGLLSLPGWGETREGRVRLVELARRLEAPLVVIHPPWKCRSMDDAVVTRYIQGVDVAQKAGGGEVELALENMSFKREGDRLNPFTDLTNLRAFAGDHGLAMTLDTSHAASFGFDILESASIFRDRMKNLHLSDYKPRSRLLGNRILTNHFAQHQVPGTGVLPLRALLASLAADGYSGNVSLEVGPIPTRAWWRPTLRRKMAAMAAFVRQARDGEGA